MISVSLRPLMQHIISGLILVSWPAYGTEHQLPGSQLEKEFQAFGQFTKLSARFEQIRTVKAWDSEIKTSGQFSMTKSQPPLILWEIKEPAYTALRIDNEGVFVKTQVEEEKWNPVGNKKMKEQIQNIFAWMSFDAASLKKDFEVSKTSDFHYELNPKNKKTHFKKIKIEVTPKRTVKTMTMVEENQDSIHIEFKDTKLL